MIMGYANTEETLRYLDRHQMFKKKTPWFFTSPVAIGTHLGNRDETDSKRYRVSIEYALKNGINFVDTAINYRGMRSERDIGLCLTQLIEVEKNSKRSEIVISSKAGIIPGDVEAGLGPVDYLKQILLGRGIIDESDLNIKDHQRHVLAPAYFEFAIGESKKHLNLSTIDIYYIHNPEISMEVIGPERFYKQLESLFLFLEEQVKKGNIRFYGFATWEGLLSNPDQKDFISLEVVASVLKNTIGDNHHFKFIQFPFNKIRMEVLTKKNQKVNNHWLSIFEAAKEFGFTVMTSAPFHLGKLLDEWADPAETLGSILQIPEIHSIMVGMRNLDTVRKNIEIVKKFGF